MIIGIVLVVLVGGVLIARNRLLPAEETWRVPLDGAQRVLDSDAEQILLWSDAGDLVVLDRASGADTMRFPLRAPLQNAALLASGVMAHWQDAGSNQATIGVAAGPDEWLWRQQVPAEATTVVGVDAATDRMIVARSGDDPVLQGVDAATGDVVWSRPGEIHSGWLGPMDARHSFFGQSLLGVQETDGNWSLVSTEDGSVTADLGTIEPTTWQGHVVGNAVPDGCRPVVFHDSEWQFLDWEDEKPAPQCRWLQPSSAIGWLDYDHAGQSHLRPADLETLAIGPDRARGQFALSEEHPPAAYSAQDNGNVTRLVDTGGQTVWSHRGSATVYPGPDTAATISDTDTLTEVVAGSRSVRRLALVSVRGDLVAETTHDAAEATIVHHLPGEDGVVFVMDEEVILLGH